MHPLFSLVPNINDCVFCVPEFITIQRASSVVDGGARMWSKIRSFSGIARCIHACYLIILVSDFLFGYNFRKVFDCQFFFLNILQSLRYLRKHTSPIINPTEGCRVCNRNVKPWSAPFLQLYVNSNLSSHNFDTKFLHLKICKKLCKLWKNT